MKVNKTELEDILGVSHVTLTGWQEQGLPIEARAERKGQSNTYDTAVVIAWMVQRELDKAGVESLRDRLLRQQLEEGDMRIAEKRGRLIPTEQIEPIWTALVTSAKTYLRSEPDRLAHLLETMDGVDAKRDMLAETFDDFLTKLSQFDPDAIAATAASAAAADTSGLRKASTTAEDFGS